MNILFTREAIRGLLLLKIGGFPFHQWLLALGAEISWEALAILLTLQKIIPLHFLSHRGRACLLFLRNRAWVILAFARALVRKTKKLLLLSSVFFLAALTLLPVLAGGGWKKLLLAYLLIFLTFRILSGGEKDTLVSETSGGDWGREAAWLLIVLILRGAPPFLGFFVKLEIVSVLCSLQETLTACRFLASRAVFLYIYLTLLMWAVTKKQRTYSTRKKKTQWYGGLAAWGLSVALFL